MPTEEHFQALTIFVANNALSRAHPASSGQP
jgi:hypothetical protein